MFIIQDREAGNIIEYFETFPEAEKTLKKFEAEDIKNSCYIKDFYEIVESEV